MTIWTASPIAWTQRRGKLLCPVCAPFVPRGDRNAHHGAFARPLTCGFVVELRGLEPLTPTLPVPSEAILASHDDLLENPEYPL